MSKVGEELGLLFQIADDLLDVKGSKKSTGKPVKKDHKKATTKEKIANLKIEYVRVCHRCPSCLIRVMTCSCCYAMPSPDIYVFIFCTTMVQKGIVELRLLVAMPLFAVFCFSSSLFSLS